MAAMKILKALFSLLMLVLLVVTALFVDFTYKTFSAEPRVPQADAIVVLAGGSITDIGTHDELLARGGEYAKLYSVYLQDDTAGGREEG